MADDDVQVKTESETKAIKDDIKQEANITMDQDSVHSQDLTANQTTHTGSDSLVKNENTSSDPQRKVRKRKRIRCIRRRSKKAKLAVPTEKPALDNISSSESEDEYCLKVSNLPNSWSYIEIKNYIDTVCGPVDEIEFVQSDSRDVSGAIRLFYPTMDECERAKQKLENKFVEGKQLCVKIEASPGGSDKEISNTELTPSVSWGTNFDTWDEDPTGLYGLKPEFLKSLNITPPLAKWVCVSNFRCDKAELRDVLELAGHVLMCAVFTVQHKYARVLYSHPLEAVQAVSMLNGQLFYRKKLSVIMDKCSSDLPVLPKGLTNIGLGLGTKGHPLRNIEKHYKRHITQRSSLVNPALFSSVNNSESYTSGYVSQETDIDEKMKEIKLQIDSQKESLKFKNVEDVSSFVVTVDKGDSDSDGTENDKKTNEIKTITSATRKVVPARISPSSRNVSKQTPPVRQLVPATQPAGINPNFINGMTAINVTNTQPCPPGLSEFAFPGAMNRPALGPNSVPRPGFAGAPMPGPRPMGPRPMPGPVAGPMRGPMPPYGPGPRPPVPNPMAPGPFVGPRPFGPQPMPNPNSATVRLRNLPLSTTFTCLCEKLSKCGQVLSLQLTEPGCALVTFGNRAQAERCYQTYNRLLAENCTIEVYFI